MNAICNVLNIGHPVPQIMNVSSFVSGVLKNDMKVLLLVQTCNNYGVVIVSHKSTRKRDDQ